MHKSSSPVLSVIIPVYNTDTFLSTCLESILSQKGVDIEVIIVNDGSSDSSLNTILKYAKIDKRIRYVSQHNQGLSVARNTGLQLAIGEYVLFVDSDDWVLTDSLAYYINLILRTDVEVVLGKVNIYYENGATGIWRYDDTLHSKQPIMSGEEYLHSVVHSKKFTPMVYNYFCRRSMLVKSRLFFKPGLIHEDELWTPHMLLHAKTVSFGAIPHYAYRRRSAGSITSSTPPSVRLQSLIQIIISLSHTYHAMSASSPACSFFIMDIRAIYFTCAQIALKNSNAEKAAFENMSTSLLSIMNDNIIRRSWFEYCSIKQNRSS